MRVKSIDEVIEFLENNYLFSETYKGFFQVNSFDGRFDICSFETMRGWNRLKDDEEKGQYYISYMSDVACVKIICKPCSNSYRFERFIIDKRKKHTKIERFEDIITYLALWCLEI